jgi:hypothetical protein
VKGRIWGRTREREVLRNLLEKVGKLIINKQVKTKMREKE